MIHISFDLDGTIIDSRQSVADSFITALQLHGITVPEQLEIGPTLDELVSKYVTECVDKQQSVRADFIKLYDYKYAIMAPLYPGIEELLCTLKSYNHCITLVTNKREIPTRKILEHYQLENFFQTVICSDQNTFGCNKAARLGHIKRTKMTNIYVGDTSADQTAAKTAGYDFLCAKWGYEEFPSKKTLVYPHNLIEYIDD